MLGGPIVHRWSMVNAIEERAGELAELCRRFGVKRLDVFGSAAEGRFDPDRSDIDFLVEFDLPDPVDHARAYFGVLCALTGLFSRDVDLVETRAVTNRYFLESINRARRQIYAAWDGGGGLPLSGWQPQSRWGWGWSE